MQIFTEIFGKKVRKPNDITEDIDFEYYALEVIERRANEFIEEHNLTRNDIITYKVKLRRSFEKVKKSLKGGKEIIENAEFIYARIYLTYATENEEQE